MSYKSGFFDAIDQGDGDYDREYIAADFSHYFSLFIANGVFPDPSTNLQVKASAVPDMHVSVQPGSGWVNGYYITVPEESPELLTIPTANPTLSRIDSVIMGLNYVDREIQLYVKSGAVSSSPTPVELQRDTDLYELELCQITVKAGAASITQSSIKDTRQDSSRCGIVKGTVDQIDATDLFAQYDAAFQEWFEDVQSQLEGDVATNLLNRIIQLEQTVEEHWKNTASSETKAIYNLSDENTPDDIFQAIFAVGDIKVSTRTDLGDNWLLCNGENFSPEEYPGLNSFFSQEAIDWQDKSISNPDLINPILNIGFCNGFWFLHLSDALYFSSDVEGPWKKCNLPDSTIPRAVIFFNGKYYGFSGIQIREATSPDSQWVACPNIGTISGVSRNNHKCKPVACGNKVVSIIQDSSDGQAVPIYTSDPSSGGWVRGSGISLDVRIADCDYGVYHGGTVVFASTNVYAGASGVTCKNIDADSPTFERTGPATVGYVDGKWIYGTSTLHAVDNLDDPRNESNKITDNAVYPGIVCEIDDFIIIRGRNGEATIITKSGYEDCGTVSAGKAATATMGGYAASDGTKVAAIGTANGSLSMPSGLGLTKTIGTLPVVSIDSAYCYIRGK